MALLSEKNLTAAAHRCSVNEKTLRRWMIEDEAFNERAELERRVRSLKIRSEDARRARVILMLADGDSRGGVSAFGAASLPRSAFSLALFQLVDPKSAADSGLIRAVEGGKG